MPDDPDWTPEDRAAHAALGRLLEAVRQGMKAGGLEAMDTAYECALAARDDMYRALAAAAGASAEISGVLLDAAEDR